MIFFPINQRLRAQLLVFCSIIIFSHTGFANIVLEPYLYQEGFEGTNPVQFWTTNGTYTVNQIGITTDKAFSGTHSYVIDITINSGSYFYWKIPMQNVPCENILNLSGRIWAERIAGTASSVKLGINMFSSHCGIGGCDGSSPLIYNQWCPVSLDAVSQAEKSTFSQIQAIWGLTGNNLGNKINMIGIFINGSAGDRIRVYLDDIKLEGTIPTVASFGTEISSRWALYTAKFNAKMNEITSTHTNAQNNINNLPGNLSAFELTLKTEAQARLDYINANYSYTTITNRGWLTLSEYNILNYNPDQACGIVDGIYMHRAGTITRKNHLLYNVLSTKKTTQAILPDASNIPACIKNNI
ncbi:MAG: hypothetical protein WCV67_16050 [Victivallaceae bacterium]|jgi:hypothetical protein